MKSGQTGRRGKKHRSRGGNGNNPASLAAHKAFAPVLGLWGALLGGLVIAVMPFPLVSRALEGTLLGTWGEQGQTVIAAIAATLLGSVMLGFAALQHRRAIRRTGPSVLGMAMRQVTPINPAQDLGSERLDDPVDAMPFTTPAWRDADLEDQVTPPVRDRVPQPQPASPATSKPIELDLAQFGELPGRNGVWVDEPATTAAPTPAPAAQIRAAEAAAAPKPHPIREHAANTPPRHLRAVASPPPPPGQAALARLRATPADKLTLIEMVERFAGALHEHRETAPSHKPGPADLAAREAALAEAIKALAALSGGMAPAPRRDPQAEPLRQALAQLQPRRGVA